MRAVKCQREQANPDCDERQPGDVGAARHGFVEGFGDAARPDASATSVSGMFSQNIHRQPTVSVSRPPISGPAALPNPAMP
jgi:hypothetical protein